MTRQIPQSIDVPENILTALNALTPDRKQQVFDFVEFLMQKQQETEANALTQKSPSKQRTFGQHKGMGWISDDFDAPLSDDFWIGEEGSEHSAV